MPDTAGLVFLGVDIGTYEAKAVALDSEGRVIGSAVCAHRPNSPLPGRLEHDAESIWWGGLVQTVRELLAAGTFRADQVTAIGCSGIGPCVLPVDEELVPLGPAILYGVDTRANAQITEITGRLGTQEIRQRSGNQLTSQSAGPKIAWLRDEQPRTHAASAQFLTCQSFLVGRLTGTPVIDHLTASYFHPLYDITAQDWNVDGCEDFARRDQLPQIAWSGQVAGVVTASAAAQTGLPAGIPVAVGTADAPAEALAAGTQAAGDMMIMYGSSSFIIEVIDRPANDDVLWSAPYLFPGSWQLAGGTSTAGTMTRWAIDALDLDRHVGNAFDILVTLASESEPGARGLIVLPYLSGERTPLHNADVRGMISGLELRHSRADLARGAIEGVAHSMVAAIDAFRVAGAPPLRVTAVGGGVANPLWLQAVSDISGLTQRVGSAGGAAQGSAMLGALAAGAVTIDGLRSWTRDEGEVRPDPQTRQLYRRAHDDFLRWTRAAVSLARPQEQDVR